MQLYWRDLYTDPYNTYSPLTTGPPTISSGGIVFYPSTGGTVSSIEPGTSGVLVIYGTYLTAGGQDMNPEVTVSNGVTLNGFQSIADGQLNVNYIAANASPGQATVTVTTNVSPPATAPIQVGDLTPVITGVSETSFVVGTPAPSFTITGQHFGTKCTVAFPFTVESVSTSCSDSSISVTNLTPSEAGSGEITVTADGYGGQGFDGDPGQSSRSGSSPTVTATYTEVTIVAWLNASAVVLPTGENSILQGDLKSPGSCAIDVGSWALGGTKDLILPADWPYASAYLVQNSGNSAPPITINPFAYYQGGNFRMFNDYGNPAAILAQSESPLIRAVRV